MSDEQQAPVWHSCVGDGWEPVQFSEMTLADEDVLRAGGWVRANDGGGFAYGEDRRPRRRRKKSLFTLEIRGTRDGSAFEHAYTIKPGERISASDDGFLVFLDKPQTEGQVQS